mgnify:CR=1 FL=1
MIAEYIEALLTPAPKWAKHMELLNEAIAISARAKRCCEAWAPHQQHTKEAIIDAMEACDQHRIVLVVGSGSCLDIPLAELANKFKQVILIDVVHPLKSKRHGWNHVVQITQDITGQLETLYNHPETLPEMYAPNIYHDVPEIDLVLSVNLASQLPIMPLKYLADKMSHDEKELNRFAKNLIRAHFTWLSGFTCTTALICDQAWERLDATGKLIELDDPLYGLISQKTTREWYWDVAPTHETGTDFSHRNHVGYWANFLFVASDDLSANPNCIYAQS